MRLRTISGWWGNGYMSLLAQLSKIDGFTGPNIPLPLSNYSEAV